MLTLWIDATYVKGRQMRAELRLGASLDIR